MVPFIVLTAVYLIVELIYFLVYRKRKKHREKMTIQSLYKLMEVRVLNRTLQNRISSEQAAEYEYQQFFVRVECLDAKPWMACLFAMDECVTIGRSMENKVSVRDDLLSRMHCKLMVQNHTLYLQDMGTTNGTGIKRGILRKVMLQPHSLAEIQSGDVIYIGHYRMKIRFYYGYQIYM